MSIDTHAPAVVDYVNKFRALKEFEDVVVNIKAYGKYLAKFRDMEAGKKPRYELAFLD